MIELKIGQNQKGRLWVHDTPILEVIFVTLTENYIYHNKWNPVNMEISTVQNIAAGTHLHAQHGTKTTPAFLPVDGEASWSLLPNLVSLLSGNTVQPKNTYSVSSRWQVRSEKDQNQTKIKINTTHSYHQRSSLLISLNWSKDSY